MSASVAAALNQHCLRNTLDASRLLLPNTASATYANLFAPVPIFVSVEQTQQMHALIAAIERVVRLPWYQHKVLGWAPEIARHTPAARGVFMGYDFHINAAGCKLIEINTNAGGAMLNAALLRAQQACCADVTLAADPEQLEQAIIAMFREEWRRQRGNAPLRRIAIVDDKPDKQFLYPEFVLFSQLFAAHGIETVIADPAELHYANGTLSHKALPIDLVYNRLTDFALQTPACRGLREAYLADQVVLTPHPHAHALYADKRSLTLLSNTSELAAAGVDATTVAVLQQGIPRTEFVTAARAEEFWSSRAKWFFKPYAGFGSKAVYRGDKLTRRVFADIIAGGYLAQELVPPGERRAQAGDAVVALKVDWRNYVYNGEVQLMTARLYQGQTTNFRTPGGGFAAVYRATQRQPACIKQAMVLQSI